MQTINTFNAIVDALPTQNVPDPGGGSAPPGTQGFTTILSWGKWLAFGIAMAALIAAGAMLGWGGRMGDGGEHGSKIGRALVGVVVISAAFAVVGFLAT